MIITMTITNKQETIQQTNDKQTIHNKPTTDNKQQTADDKEHTTMTMTMIRIMKPMTMTNQT